MNTMHQEGNALIYENDGELLRIEPWGKNSLRLPYAEYLTAIIGILITGSKMPVGSQSNYIFVLIIYMIL